MKEPIAITQKEPIVTTQPVTYHYTDHTDFLLYWIKQEDIDTARNEVSKETERLICTTGRGLVLTEADLSNCNLEGFNLRKANLNRTQLYGTNLSKANLSGASIISPGLERTKLIEADLSGAYLHALAATASDFSGANFSNVIDATGSLFHGCAMVRVQLDNAVLSGVTFYQCDLSQASLKHMNLQGATFNECVLTETDFSGSLVAQLTITKSQAKKAILNQVAGHGLVLQRLTGCDELQLNNANVPALRIDSTLGCSLQARSIHAPNASFIACALPNTDLFNADLSSSNWNSCSLDGINLKNANLSGASFTNCSMAQADLSNVLAENLRVLESKLVGARMAGFAGRSAIFRDCDLSEANMKQAYLYRAMLTGDPPKSMSMQLVNLEGANLAQAYLAADLSGANLRGANCVYARLNQSVLHRADLTGANLYQASLVKTDVRGAKLIGIKAPIFADRCPGLMEAEDVQTNVGLSQFLCGLRQLIAQAKGGST